MAIGLALLFGVRLPLNFFSPYKSRNIVEFWRRWHITLSRFLRDYVYISLGGNRKGGFARYRNLFTTMLVGGLWHGAAWTYVFWGALHGAFLVICHGWTALVGHEYRKRPLLRPVMAVVSPVLTFLSVTVALAFFRADSFHSALLMVKALCGLQGIYLDPEELTFHHWLTAFGLPVQFSPYAIRYVDKDVLHHVLIAYAIIWFLPNTAQLFAARHPAIDEPGMMAAEPSRLQWKPGPGWALFVAVLLLVSLLNMNNVSEFLYFRF